MFGHYNLGRILDIPVRIHRSLVWLAVAFAVLAGLGSGLPAVVANLALAVVLFGTVLLHELGHSVAARAIGIGTRDITLYPFGGIAHLERMPREPRREILVALAGPAVNFVLAAVFALLWFIAAPGAIAGVLEPLIWINLGLGTFNLLPGFPMDGGRVLRALLALRMPHARATILAARIGRAVAVALGIAGLLWTAPALVLVAVFVWFAAGAEAGAAELEQRASSAPSWLWRMADIAGGERAPGRPRTVHRAVRTGPFFGAVVIEEDGPSAGPRRPRDVVIDVTPSRPS